MIEYRNSRQFQMQVLNFPEEVYRINDPSTHIFKYMYTLLQIGVAQIGQWQDEACTCESLPGTKYTDLDALFAFLGVSRNPNEIYPYEPYTAQLTADQWNEIMCKDALYRLRIAKFLHSLLRGGTLEGIQMAASAASGVDVQVFEVWRVINGRGLAAALDIERPEALNLAKEFVIIPAEEIDDNQRAAIIHLVEVIKPVNTICTVLDSATLALSPVDIGFSASEDYYFEVRRMVTASSDPTFAAADVWIQPNQEVEGPTYAGMDHSDTTFSLNEAVTSVKAFTVDSAFRVDYAILNGGINGSVTTIVVTEASEPAAPSFEMKIDDEIMFVTDRVPVVGTDNDFTYSVLRGHGGTTAASHTDGHSVYAGVVASYSPGLPTGTGWGTWQAIPLADSPDNYPAGKFAGDPAKYDSLGNYIYDYDSQASFVAWYTTQVQSLGGEVSGTRFRLPITNDSVAGVVSTPLDVLAPPEFSVAVRIYPER